MKHFKRYLVLALAMILCFSISTTVLAAGKRTGYIKINNIPRGANTVDTDVNPVVLSGGTSTKLQYCITPQAGTNGQIQKTKMTIVIQDVRYYEKKSFTATVDGNSYTITDNINLPAGTYYVNYRSVDDNILAASFSFFD